MNGTSILAAGSFVLGLAAALLACHWAAAEDAGQANAVLQNFIVSHDQCRVRDTRMIVGGRDYPAGQWFSGHWRGKAFTLALEPGKEAVIEGGYGWQLRVIAEANQEIKVTGVSRGPHLYHEPAIVRSGTNIIIDFPSLRAVEFQVPPTYYEWSVVPAPEGAQVGNRTLRLPLGWFTMQGRLGWAVQFRLLEDGVQITGVESAVYGLQAGDVRADGLAISLSEPRLPSVFIQVPDQAGEWSIRNVLNRMRGSGPVALPPGSWQLEGPRIGKVTFTIGAEGVSEATLAPAKDPLIDSVKVGAREDAPSVRESFAPGNVLRLEAKPAAAADLPKAVELYAFTKDSRRVYRAGEVAELTVVILSPADAPAGTLRIAAESERGAWTLLDAKPGPLNAGRNSFHYRLRTGVLAPSRYRIVCSFAGKSATQDLVVKDANPQMHFPLLAYDGTTTPADLDLFRDTGLNMVIINSLSGEWVNRPRLPRGQEEAYASGWRNAAAPPIETAIGTPAFLDYLQQTLERNLRVFGQHGAGHQFFHQQTCFLDPEIQRRVTQSTISFASAATEFPHLVAINLGDEMGTHRGVIQPEGCDYCRGLFREQYGPVPRDPMDDAQRWRQWMDFKQDMLNQLMAYVNVRLKKVGDFAISSQHGAANFYPQDGGYPPKAMTEFEVSAGHWYYPWGPSTLFPAFGTQLARFIPRDIPYWPFIDGRYDSELGAMQLYTTLLGGADGIGYFLGPNRWAKGMPEYMRDNVHPFFRTYGDLLAQIDVDYDNLPVGIVYSYTQHVQDCYAQHPTMSWIDLVRKYLYRVAACWYALERAQVPARLVCEEQIVGGSLDRMKVLFIPALDDVSPAVERKLCEFAAGGGSIYADAETRLEIPGMKRLDGDFSAYYKAVYRDFKSVEEDLPFVEQWVPKLRQIAVDEKLRLPAAADSPCLITAEQLGGAARYIFLVNDNFVRVVPGATKGEFAPLKAAVTIPAAPQEVCYDVIAGKKVALPSTDLPSPPLPLSKLGEGVGVRMEFKALEMKVLFIPALDDVSPAVE
ncbi:MAG TPA: hypothetical protein VM223_07515, partial [Planctomycetota bacterium]|nr:hypothetical protein [Planctomycetota bacterium]